MNEQSDDEEIETEPTAGDTPARLVLSYVSPTGDGDALVTLESFQGMEAELACAKLNAEGIRCFAANSQIAAAHPFLGVSIEVQVRREDLERARAVLAQRAVKGADDEYADEPWRCPNCRQKTIDLLPQTGAQWMRRNIWFVMLVMPFVWVFLPMNEVLGLSREGASELGLAWCVVMLGLGVWVVLTKRGKRCRECGWTKPA
ncbi:MAG TPA: DUF2007 domain-containing protein [Tepidisphaeraceae bacterium]|jgi:hypothetical protein|nr:DUF2007 domain-containing protein [Tepidisphaeraceae bacterium]